MKNFLLVSVLAVSLTACGTTPTTTPSNTPTPTVSATPKPEPYSLADIAEHNTKDDCWFAIEGKVYNVTQYIASGMHGGGEAIIQGCGKDASELFNTRPMGSGTAHSEQARSFLPNFYIGELE